MVVPIPVVSILAAGATGFVGYGFVVRQRRLRHHRLRMAWPGVIDHIRAGIRSGSDITRAVGALPSSLPTDISVHVDTFRANVERGMGTDAALADLGRGLADPVGDRIIEVMRMAHDVGGTDLPDVLLSLQQSVRHDIAVREDAHAKQSWIRSAAALAVAAPWVVLVVIGSRGDTASSYQTLQGTLILVIGALVSFVAHRMMRSIGALPEQRRWLT
jgi:tight adherence protein B